jgi:tetratricopeptide (TPR) repeat protein
MKKRIFVIAVILSAVLYWPPSWSIENPAVRNPIGPSTVPPSAFGSPAGSPAAIDTSGNLLITGNVRRGRHFRGEVPYQSPTKFGANLGSSALSSFLRDSAGPEDLGTYSNRYGTQPYYSPTETVTTMLPGRPDIFMPENTRAGIRIQQDARAQAPQGSLPQQPSLYGRAAAAADSGVELPAAQYGPLAQSRLMQENKLGSQRPSFALGVPFQTGMSPNPLNTRQPEQAQIDTNRQSRMSTAEPFGEQVQDVRDAAESTGRPDLHSAAVTDRKQQEDPWQKNNAYDLQTQQTNIGNFRHLFSQKRTNWPAAGDFQTGRVQTASDAAGILGETGGDTSDQAGTGQDWEQRDVLERIRRQLEDLSKSINMAIQSQRPLTHSRDIHKDAPIDQVTQRTQKSAGYTPYIPASANSQKTSSLLAELDKLSQAEISAEANRIMGEHKSLDSLSQSKFNQHMRDAEANLKAGRYYHAASSFSLASVYQPENPLALAGRGHALFAAGEYVSSALFISRALAISPAYLRTRVDLASILGGQDKLAGRIADIEQWSLRDGSGRLQFLLGYVYYRTGQLTEAKKAIDAAYAKTPESAAVQVMRITIDNMLINQ